jgi:hypothetical protein
MADWSDKVPDLLTAIDTVDAARALAESALGTNPTIDEDLELRRTLLRLSSERAVLEVELDAALEGSTSVHASSEAQLVELAALREEVDNATANVAASVAAKITLARKVLASTDSLLSIIGPWPPK